MISFSLFFHPFSQGFAVRFSRSTSQKSLYHHLPKRKKMFRANEFLISALVQMIWMLNVSLMAKLHSVLLSLTQTSTSRFVNSHILSLLLSILLILMVQGNMLVHTTIRYSYHHQHLTLHLCTPGDQSNYSCCQLDERRVRWRWQASSGGRSAHTHIHKDTDYMLRIGRWRRRRHCYWLQL